MIKIPLKVAASLAVACSLFLSGCSPEPIEVTCNQSVEDLQANQGTTEDIYVIRCPANCSDGAIWGTDIYTADSSICTAARHAGAMGKEGGEAEIEILPGRKSYEGSIRNEVSTGDWPEYKSSFSFR